MKDPVVIIGIGEIGGVLSRGFLRAGHPVYPVTRDMDMEMEARHIPEPEVVVLAVAEKDLHPTLEKIPAQWRERLALVQNELLPRDWKRHGLANPTVMSIWFEKKPGQDVKVVVPSPAHGPHAGLLTRAIESVDIPGYQVDDEQELLFELVRKNLYILTTNIAGLKMGSGDVEALWEDNRELARSVAKDVLAIQEYLTGRDLDEDKLIEAMVTAFEGDPQHKCMGRSAPQRLERALKIAEEGGVDVPVLREIAEQTT